MHSTVASSAVRLRRDGVTLNFDLSTQKRNQVMCPKMHQWKKFGENLAIDTGDIVETWKSGMHSVTPWPWTLNFWPQNLISSSLSRDAPVTKVWRKSVNRCWSYRGNIKLPRESWMDEGMHAHTHVRADSGTDGRPAAEGWQKFGKNPSIDTGHNVETYNSRAHLVMLWPWHLTFWPQNLISSSLSRDAQVTKVIVCFNEHLQKSTETSTSTLNIHLLSTK